MQQIHIGNLIRDELRRQGHTNQWLADRIGITPRTLQKLFNKPSIDTQQLLTICRALGVDLFRHYSDALATHVQFGHPADGIMGVSLQKISTCLNKIYQTERNHL